MSKTMLLSFALLSTIVCAVPALERASVDEGTIGANQPNGQTGDGKSFPDTDREKEGDACECSTRENPCTGNVGSKNLTCDSGHKFIQCTAAVCAVQSCPEKSVWNETTKECTECPAIGFHISADKQFCACNERTTYDFTTRKCVACPVNATILPDECFCPKDQPLSATKDSCLPCPAETKATEEFGCECNNASLFWSNAERTCKPCPGEWKTLSGSPKSSETGGAALCQCPGTNDIFDRESVSCVTCPPTSVAVKAIRKELPDFCRCLVAGQMVDEESKVCECRTGQEIDKVRNLCVPASAPGLVPS